MLLFANLVGAHHSPFPTTIPWCVSLRAHYTLSSSLQSHCHSAGTRHGRAQHGGSSAVCRPGTQEKLCWDWRGAKERGKSGRGLCPSLTEALCCGYLV